MRKIVSTRARNGKLVLKNESGRPRTNAAQRTNPPLPGAEICFKFAAMPFQLVSKYKPRGDQPQAIQALVKSLQAGHRYQTLLGVTGSGKTFTMANVIQQLDRPALVISHNKTLAAQLYSEFKQFFPHNAVEYFVSYYDYYQPEAYIPQTDTYIAKDSSINENGGHYNKALFECNFNFFGAFLLTGVKADWACFRPLESCPVFSGKASSIF